MLRLAPLVWIIPLVVAVAAAPLLAGVPPLPSVVGPAASAPVFCPGQDAFVVSFYDYEPEDPDWWAAVSFRFPSEAAWFLFVYWPTPGSEGLEAWVDRNRDSVADEHYVFASLQQMVEQLGTPCDLAQRMRGR